MKTQAAPMTTRTLHYRLMADADCNRAASLVARVFHECIAPLYDAEGVASFESYIRPAEFGKRLRRAHFALLAERGGDLVGLIEVKEHRRITLLFVAVEHQRQGIGRELVRLAARSCSVRRPELPVLAVSASPNAVGAYEKMGFASAGPELRIEGIRFVPMLSPLPLPENR
ncbi:MAG: GNAT family N-acetyltransferase [Desulfobacteraceae bacterium]|nr:GNAT family N-acetyltransferase [Desulfobacteraceae bacterium]